MISSRIAQHYPAPAILYEPRFYLASFTTDRPECSV